jgi:hypothetical protein
MRLRLAACSESRQEILGLLTYPAEHEAKCERTDGLQSVPLRNRSPGRRVRTAIFKAWILRRSSARLDEALAKTAH